VRGPRLDHLAVAVRDLQVALRAFEALGLRCSHVEEVPGEEVRVAFVPAGDVALELLEPTSSSGVVARFLASRGEGVHHVAFRVSSLQEALSQAHAAGLRPVPPAPRLGARGTRVAFLNPKDTSGVLVELVEDPTD